MPAASEHIAVTVSVAGGRTRQAGFRKALFATTFAGASRQYGPFTSVAALTAASLGSAPALAWAAILMAQQPAPVSFKIGRIDAGDASLTASLDAIEAAGPAEWYGTNIEDRVEADILLAAAWHETRRKILVCQSDDAAILAGTAGNVALDLQTAAYNRTALVYHSADAEYLDAAVLARGLAMDIDADNGAGTWAYKQFSGIATADELTDAQAIEIQDANANWYGLASAPSGVDIARFFYPGTMASGRFIDNQVSNDWVEARIQEAIIGAFVAASSGNGSGIPFDDGGIGRLRGVVLDVLRRGVRYGHFAANAVSPATGRITPWVDAPRKLELSTQQVSDRAVTFTAEVVYRGSIHSASLAITIEF